MLLTDFFFLKKAPRRFIFTVSRCGHSEAEHITKANKRVGETCIRDFKGIVIITLFQSDRHVGSLGETDLSHVNTETY